MTPKNLGALNLNYSHKVMDTKLPILLMNIVIPVSFVGDCTAHGTFVVVFFIRVLWKITE